MIYFQCNCLSPVQTEGGGGGVGTVPSHKLMLWTSKAAFLDVLTALEVSLP